jgi:hypothetical protein
MGWKFVCQKNGKQVDLTHAYIDGYDIGERLLEGVPFKVELTGRKFKCSTTPGSETYMDSLNKKKWLREARAYAATQDFFMETESGGQEVWVVDEDTGEQHPHIKATPTPVAVGMTRAADLFGNMG